MLVQVIFAFIQHLKNENELTESDRIFCISLENGFSKRKVTDTLTFKDIQFIHDCYKVHQHNRDTNTSHRSNLIMTKDYWIDFVRQFKFYFDPDYSNSLMPNAEHSKSNILEIKKQDSHPCWRLIIFLLTTRCDLAWRGTTISLWDQKNIVLPKVAEMYGKLWSFINSNQTDNEQNTYEMLISDFAKDPIKPICWFNINNSADIATKWLGSLQNKTLSLQDIYLFEAEVLLGALLAFKPNDSVVREKIESFLDELIHTYAQNNKKPKLQLLRVNILFNKLMIELNDRQKEVIQCLNSYCGQEVEAKASFITNCLVYINNRLTQIELLSQLGNKDRFFPLNHYSPILQVDADTPLDVIISLKKTLNALENPEMSTRLISHLTKLAEPILSVDQKEDAARSTNASDYLGCWT